MARKHFLATCLISTAIVPAALHADGPLPTDPTVVFGDVTITNPSDVQMLLQQAGQAGIIDWGSFSIASGYGVDFQNGNGATLNRVTGNDLSQIMGSLTSTGSVFLINQNGIIVGREGVVRTGGDFVASTLDIGNQDFLDGGDNVFAGDNANYVINLGRISALGGDVALLARNVVNEGTITAPNGTVGLVAGREILMRDASVDDGLFAVRIGSPDSSVSERGAIAAAAAELRANGGNVYALAGNTEGTIAATGVAKVKGRVFLTAGDEGKVKVDKTVTARNADGSGGRIDVNGGTVEMAGTLDASGTKGGVVVINSAIETTFTGTVLAYGDDFEGSGGFAEVSGQHLSFDGAVDTGGGTLLIDPNNIEIAGENATLLLGGASQITTQDLATLLGTQDVIIETSGGDGESGTIAVSDSVFYDSAFSLTLLAHGDILAIESIQNSGSGDINLVAGWDGSTSTTTFDPSVFDNADLATQTIFGNSAAAGYVYDGGLFQPSGTVLIGGQNRFAGTAVGSRAGATRVYAANLALIGNNTDSVPGFAELGFNVPDNSTGDVTGAIVVRATGDITLTGGEAVNASAQIGHGGMNTFDGTVTVAIDAPITIEALGNMSLIAGTDSANTFAMVGHGSLDTFGFQAAGTRQGDITITLGGELSLDEFASPTAGFFNDAWIGHQSQTFLPTTNADILITAAAIDDDASTLVGSGGTGILDIAMIAEDLEGGNVTITTTDSGLALFNQSFGSGCECNNISTATDLVIETTDDIVLDPGFFFSNTGGGNAALASGADFQNNSNGTGFGAMRGIWLVYSGRPDNNANDIGVMAADFIAYGADYNSADPFPASLPAGSGLVYRVTPVVTVGPLTAVYGDGLTLPTVSVTVGGLAINPADFGFEVSTGFVDPTQVTFSADGFVNAGFYAQGLTADVTADAASVVSGVTLTAGALTIDQRVVTVTLADQIRDYDGTTGYTGTVTYANFAGTDDETIITAGPDFGFTGGDGSGRNAGSYTVTASGLTEGSGNYAFDVSDTATLTINQLTLTAFITGNPTKFYDGTTEAFLGAGNFFLSGFIAGEGATVTQTSGTYSTANASSENSVSANLAAGDFTADAGTLLANYVLPTFALGTGSIDQAVLTAAIIGNPTKTYDGNIIASLLAGNFQLTGFAAGEGATVTQTTGSYDSADAGARTVTATLGAGDFTADAGTLLANYVLPTSAIGAGTITRASLTITAAIIGDPTKVYDGTNVATLTAANFQLSGFIDGEGATVTETQGAYASANASATNLITAILTAGDFLADEGTNLNNYDLPTTATGNGIITQAVLTAAIIGNPTKVYDGTTLANLLAGNFQLTGFVAGEGATVTQTAGSYNSANVVDADTVTTTLAAGDFTADAGTLLSNYVLPTSAAGGGTITQAVLSAAIIGNPTKVYDGNALAALLAGNFQLTGFVAGEGAMVTQTAGAYDSANAGARTVTATLGAGDFAADAGTLLSNYALPTSASGAGTITQAVLTAAIIGNPTKVYDGTTLANLLAGNFQLTGFVAGEGATVTQTAGSYNSKDVVDADTVTAALGAGDFAADAGTLLSNYVLPTTASGAGTITQAVLTAAIIGNPTKTYDGNALAALLAGNFQLTGFVAGEGATVTQTAGSYDSANAGARTVTAALAAGDLTADAGTLLSNYVLPTSAAGGGTITQAVLSAAIIGNPTKVYDGTTAAFLTSGNFVLTGFIAGEGATVTQTAGSYDSANAGGRGVTAALGGGDFAADSGTLLSNYILPTTASGAGTITQAVLTAAIIGNPTRAYDGTTVANLIAGNFALTGFVAGEGATVTLTTGSYNSKNVVEANTVTAALAAGDFAADAGTLLSNYILPTTASGAGTITQAVLTAAIIGNPAKPFDGTTQAVLTPGNFQLTGFVAGEGATVSQSNGSYSSSGVGGQTVTANLAPGDFTADAGTLLSNYALPATASGPGSIGVEPPAISDELTIRGIDAFDTTPLGEPKGPADGLEVISTETTKQIIDEINAGVAFCKQLVRQEYMVDCLSDRLQSVADGLSAVGEYSEVRAALQDAADKLHALALANSSASLPQSVHRTSGRSSSRPLTAVNDAALASVNAQAAEIINSTELVLLRSSANSERRRVAFEQISQVVDSTKVLLRSS